MSRRDAMNIHSSEAGATYEHIFYERRLDHTSLFYRDLGARWLTTRSKKDIRRSNKNRLTLSNSPIYGWWRPAWNLSFEGRVRNVATAFPPLCLSGQIGRGAHRGNPPTPLSIVFLFRCLHRHSGSRHGATARPDLDKIDQLSS